MADLPRFLCGHLTGEEPITDKDKGPLCGTQIHWSRFEGVPAAINEGPPSDEVRVTSATGGQKGQKLERFDLIPVGALLEVARVYGKGAEKYADRNWELGYAWSLSFAAMQRHAWAFWSGHSRDNETGVHHLASVIFHAMALMEFEGRSKGTDDRSIG